MATGNILDAPDILRIFTYILRTTPNNQTGCTSLCSGWPQGAGKPNPLFKLVLRAVLQSSAIVRAFVLSYARRSSHRLSPRGPRCRLAVRGGSERGSPGVGGILGISRYHGHW